MSEHGHDNHGGHEEKKGPDLPHLDDKVDEEFEKDLDKYDNFSKSENITKLQNHFGSAHDMAYQSFKKKFEELANDHHEPLAERGKELSEKHLNDLLETYVLSSLKEIVGKNGEKHLEVYNKAKKSFNDESEREHYIRRLAIVAGLDDERGQGIYGTLRGTLKANKFRHHSVINDLAGKIKESLSHNHVIKAYSHTIGKSKYHMRSDLALKAINKIGKKIQGFDGYSIDGGDASAFHKEDIESMAKHLIGMTQNETYIIDKDTLSNYGLKYGAGKDSAGDHGHESKH